MIVQFTYTEGTKISVVNTIRDTLDCGVAEAKKYVDQGFADHLTPEMAKKLSDALSHNIYVNQVNTNNEDGESDLLPAVADAEEIRKSKIYVSSTTYEGGAKTIVCNEMYLTEKDIEKMKSARGQGICSFVGEAIDSITNIVVGETKEGVSSIIALRIPKHFIDIEGIKELGEFAEAINEMILDFAHNSINESRIQAICKDMDPLYEK